MKAFMSSEQITGAHCLAYVQRVRKAVSTLRDLQGAWDDDRDLEDCAGGYRFEVAKPGRCSNSLRTCNDLGCKDFVLLHTASARL